MYIDLVMDEMQYKFEKSSKMVSSDLGVDSVLPPETRNLLTDWG